MFGFFQKDKAHRILLLVTAVWVLVMGAFILKVPPGADTDPCWGFMVMHNMQHGGNFNILLTPDPLDIAKDQSSFLSWWSPGQYLIPCMLGSLFNNDVGHGVSLTVIICSLLGLAGYYKLFKQLGFTQWIAAISVAFIASQLFFIMPFNYYTGGEVPLFAFLGWFLYGCMRFTKINLLLLLFLFLGVLIGFFAKSSVLWMCVAAVAAVWINISLNDIRNNTPRFDKGPFLKELSLWIKNGALLAIPFLTATILVSVFYLAKGQNPAGTTGELLIRPETFLFPLASPLLSAFSIDEWVDGLIYQPDGQTIQYSTAIVALLVLTLCSFAFAFLVLKRLRMKSYFVLFAAFYLIGAVFFTYMYLKQSAISYEGRHFRIIGLLAVPGIIYLLFKTGFTKIIFFAAWLLFIYAGSNRFFIELRENRKAARGNLGISQQSYDNAAMREIIEIDKSRPNDAIFVVMSSDIAAEIYHNRVITLEPEDNPDDYFSKLCYAGKCGSLYILMPEEYVVNGKQAGIIKCFTGYHNFKPKQLSNNFCLYTADN